MERFQNRKIPDEILEMEDNTHVPIRILGPHLPRRSVPRLYSTSAFRDF